MDGREDEVFVDEEGDARALDGETGGGAGPGAGTVVVDAISGTGECDFGIGGHFPDGSFDGGDGPA